MDRGPARGEAVGDRTLHATVARAVVVAGPAVQGCKRSALRQAGEEVVGFVALEQQVAGFGEAVGVFKPGEERGQPFGGGRAELPGGSANEGGSFPGAALGAAPLQPRP